MLSTPFIRYALVPLALSLDAIGCGRATDSPPPSPPDAGVDASVSCAGNPVWLANSKGFRLWESSDSPSRFAPDASCRSGELAFEFSSATNTLSERGCTYNGPVDIVVTLTSAQTAQVVAKVSSLQTTCGRSGCGADGADQTLEITDANGIVQNTFTGDFYSGCNASLHEPFIDFYALGEVRRTLTEIIDRSIADAGDAGDSSHPPIDAANDGDSGGPVDGSQPDACAVNPVWTETSASFTYTESGGMPFRRFDASCQSANVTYEFSATARTLSQRGCTYYGYMERAASLSSSDVADIAARVGALRTSCRKGCGADAPNQRLQVRDVSGASQGLFAGDFYAGCQSTQPAVFVDFSALSALRSALDKVLDLRSPDAGVDAADASDASHD